MSDGLTKGVAVVGAIVAVGTLAWTVYKDTRLTPPVTPQPVTSPQVAPAPSGTVQAPASSVTQRTQPVANTQSRPAEAGCKAFVSAGGRYTLENTTTSGPHEIGLVQRFPIESQSLASDGCTLKGNFSGWSLALDACSEGLRVRASRAGEGDISGYGSCTTEQATGMLAYVDAKGQSWGYNFKLSRQ